MPTTTQPISTTVPILHNSQIRIASEIVLDNQSVGAVMMSGSIAVDNLKFESGKGVLEYLMSSTNTNPNIQDITAIEPQFTS